MATKLLAWCAKRQVSLSAKFLPGKLNVSQICSQGRGRPFIQSGLSTGALCLNFWEVPHIDLFATGLNNQLPIFVSPFYDPLAWAVDAMSLSWEGIVSVCISSHPPFFEGAIGNGERDLLGHSYTVKPVLSSHPWEA